MKQAGMLKVQSPVTGEFIAEMYETTVEETTFMYEKSRMAFPKWSSLTIDERLGYFHKLRNIMVEQMDEIAHKISLDTGKVKLEALVADIMPVLDFLKTLDKTANKTLGRQKVPTPLLLMGKKSYIEYMSRGTVLVISPWNYPFQLAMVPILSALVGGNCVISKPSEVTPYVGKVMEDLFKLAEFPEGVISFAHGGKELGAALTEQGPDYIFFTGSVRTGKVIQQVAAKKLIPTTLELGGKDPMIILADAHLRRAAKAAVWGAFTNSGQVCMSVERVYVDRSVYEEFLHLVKEEVANMKQGQSTSDDVGSMTFPAQIDIVRTHIEDALSQGARLETGIPPQQWKEGDMYLPMMVLSNVYKGMKILKEETFGPIMPVVPFDTVEEAIKLANDSEYGLNASIWSRDIQKAQQVASQIVTGAIVINDVIVTVANHNLPFGGAKQSGVGNYHGEVGLRIFCHEKAVMIDPGRKSSEIQWYPYHGKYELFLSLFKSYFSNRVKWITFLNSFQKLLKLSKNK
ncbi:aldehyde dehydrogenase family protein [Peribacillus alkalitolerans]|uniref:aldehyde dehydrogenase family protein n=1 Tax=Peribacillus alkalitolerans TaxID=1550385 RepID=UPI0013D8675B|nr:aldehyde dehydrogenase family protein [Peribacillus alkalitolerans]